MKYFAPEYEALLIKAQDVITSSTGDNDAGDDNVTTPDQEL